MLHTSILFSIFYILDSFFKVFASFNFTYFLHRQHIYFLDLDCCKLYPDHIFLWTRQKNAMPLFGNWFNQAFKVFQLSRITNIFFKPPKKDFIRISKHKNISSSVIALEKNNKTQNKTDYGLFILPFSPQLHWTLLGVNMPCHEP